MFIPMKYIEMLRGYKTYILSSLALGVVGANMLGLLAEDATVTILSLLGFGGMMTLRAAISTLGSK